MPTPTGKLKKGDRIRHIATNVVCVVQSRTGNDEMYGAWIRREDGENFTPQSGRSPDGKSLLLTEAAYWMRNGWEIFNGPTQGHRTCACWCACSMDTAGEPQSTCGNCRGGQHVVEGGDLEKALREAVLPHVADLVLALMNQGLSREKALSTIRWATHKLTRPPEAPARDQGKIQVMDGNHVKRS